MNSLLLTAYISGLCGSILLWFFGLPRKNINKEGTIGLAIEKEDKKMKKQWKVYSLFSHLGIFLIGLSFLLQIITVWTK